MGIPHSIFLGRPTPAPGEPYWLGTDIAKVFAWQSYARGLCDQCHTHRSDWLDDEGKPLAAPRKRFETRRWACTGCGKHYVFRERIKDEIGEDEKQWVGLDVVVVSNNGVTV